MPKGGGKVSGKGIRNLLLYLIFLHLYSIVTEPKMPSESGVTRSRSNCAKDLGSGVSL